jgi:PAS domain S-box-containing protein
VRVLVIEDNSAHARIVERWLDTPEHQLTQVSTLESALEALRSTPQDVALLDLSLPDSDGLSSLSKLLEHHHDLPVIVLTAFDDGVLASQAMQAGAQDYLLKGQVDGSGLRRALTHAIERQRSLIKSRRLGRLLQAVRNVSRLIKRADRAPELLDLACGELLAAQAYRAAWVLQPSGTLHYAGSREVPAKLEVQPDCSVLAQRPGEPVQVCPDDTCTSCPLRSLDPHTMLVTALTHRGHDYGTLCVEVDRSVPISSDELEGLTDCANELAAGLHGLRREARRRSAEVALSHSEQRFARSFASSRVGMALVAEDGELLDVNDALCEMLGYQRDALMRCTFAEVTHPDDVATSEAGLRRAALGRPRRVLHGEALPAPRGRAALGHPQRRRRARRRRQAAALGRAGARHHAAQARRRGLGHQ